MLKVNEEKFLQDYKALADKKDENIVNIEHTAHVFAVNRGYDEAQTEAFIKYVKSVENDGLTGNDKVRFEILNEYVEESDIDFANDDEATETEAASGETINSDAY